jgi:hypothetical protein
MSSALLLADDFHGIRSRLTDGGDVAVGEIEAPRTSPGRRVGAAFLATGAVLVVVAACDFDRAGVLVAIEAQVIGAKWNCNEPSGT